jgi:hypothetical protein
VANRFRPGDWRQVSRQIKVNGFMKATPGKDGALTVHFTYIAAYWLAPARAGGAPRPVVVRRDGDVYFYGDGRRSSGEASFGGSGATSSASDCRREWPYPQFLEAWTSEAEASTASARPSATATQDFNLADPTAPQPGAPCFHDTSGF